MAEYDAMRMAIAQRLKEAEARTPSSALLRLLENHINIAPGTRERASDSHKHLREFLAGEHDRDYTFPRILSIADNDFLGGSFARHVKNWPLDDIDIYFPLDGYKLVYTEYGQVQPYTPASDDVISSNPLLTSRWTEGNLIMSKKLISEFAAVLRRKYPQSTVRANEQAVTVRMTHGETEEEDGLGYDIVPCFRMLPQATGGNPFYLMPDGKNGWLRTNPKVDAWVSDDLQEKNSKLFRKIVRLVKYWNTEQLEGALSSYYIELAIARAFRKENADGKSVKTLSLGVALAFWALNGAVSAGPQDSWVSGAPKVQPGDAMTTDHRVKLSRATADAKLAWDKECSSDNADALRIWGAIFGETFPA